ncbi:unnamed protein product [Oikopleura dioica]|uniref:Uncharacterized protein n=1 Tax=Oikopleura dioica TaxID=34765 RepID=E4XV50_OIKDI|nr:unnamed protein product [Oikopleura dioica]
MVASITEDYQEITSRPTMVPQYNPTERYNKPVALFPVPKKRKSSPVFNEAPTLIQISDDSEEDMPPREAFKYSPFSTPAFKYDRKCGPFTLRGCIAWYVRF